MKTGDKVVIAVERSIELITGILAILKIGASYVPIDPAFPEERIQYILADTASPQILLKNNALKRFTRLLANVARQVETPAEAEKFKKINIIDIDQALLQTTSKTFDEAWCANALAEQYLAAIFYTSGSTGEPKGVCVPHRAIVRLVKNSNYSVFESNDVFAHISNICFDAASFEIWCALLNGLPLVICHCAVYRTQYLIFS